MNKIKITKTDKNNLMLNKLSNHNVLIIYRQDTAKAKNQAEELALWFKKNNYKVFSMPDQTLQKGVPKASSRCILGLAVVLGGDGTYLKAIKFLDGRQTPIIGINLGSLGFLTETREDDLYEIIEDCLNGKMEMHTRALMHIDIKNGNRVIRSSLALNDVVFERGLCSNLINISFQCNKKLVCEFKADGIIIASPVGSTAYNLAAGGPIVHPETHAFVVSPICPHSLTHRPMIFPDHKVLSIQLINKTHKARITLDGQDWGVIKTGEQAVISRDSKCFLTLRRPNFDYFHILRDKLKFGQRD